MSDAMLRAIDLSIRYTGGGGPVVNGFSFELFESEILCLRGKSGSGKSTVAAALLGMLPVCGAVASGQILYGGCDLLTQQEDFWRGVRWREIALVPQSSMSAFNPVYTIRKTLREMMRLGDRKISERQMRSREEELMDIVRLDKRTLDCRAHEMSGGMKQRAAIALAMIYSPKILILDEATTGLDIKVQADVLGTILRIKKELDMAILFISHDALLGDKISDRRIELP